MLRKKKKVKYQQIGLPQFKPDMMAKSDAALPQFKPDMMAPKDSTTMRFKDAQKIMLDKMKSTEAGIDSVLTSGAKPPVTPMVLKKKKKKKGGVKKKIMGGVKDMYKKGGIKKSTASEFLEPPSTYNLDS